MQRDCGCALPGRDEDLAGIVTERVVDAFSRLATHLEPDGYSVAISRRRNGKDSIGTFVNRIW